MLLLFYCDNILIDLICHVLKKADIIAENSLENTVSTSETENGNLNNEI